MKIKMFNLRIKNKYGGNTNWYLSNNQRAKIKILNQKGWFRQVLIVLIR